MPSSILIRNIKSLVQVRESKGPLRGPKEMQTLPQLKNAWLIIEGTQIKDFGKMVNCPERADKVIDATGRMVFPSWCDSHTHLVFAGSREQEFEDRIRGLSYEAIAERGGGILNSANKLQNTPEDVLYDQALDRLEEVISYGTGAIEIKSGYGLTTDAELKMLRVIRRLKDDSPVNIKATFLGAHAIPMAFRTDRDRYIQMIIEDMLPRIANEGLADYIDVFCEKVAFSPQETELILEAGARYGLRPKIHTNQFNCMGGIQAAVAHNAISVDHLEVLNEAEISALQSSSTIATLLPSAPFFLNDHYPPARKILDTDIPVALASDFNPGSTPSGRMPFVISLACLKLKMLPEEAINAATLNGACAMELESILGSISKGKLANLWISKPMPSIAYLPYAFGSNLVDTVILRGEIQ
jgi:imidazolonepropionase